MIVRQHTTSTHSMVHEPTIAVPHLAPSYRVGKRLLDVALCLVGMPLVLPILAICGVLIYLDNPGPIFFVQRRPGRGGRLFGMLKLRSMVVNAEEKEQDLANLNELTWPDFKISRDPRVTRIGRWLRKLSLR
jgi:lipopolysaccharide/colanic/teichoic acid biosynthesis glycosyltransferase